MKVKYRNRYYKISRKGKIEFEKRNIKLKSKRIFRLAKRIIMNNYQVLYVILCLCVFMSITIPIGIYTQKYNNIFDGIWDFRGTIFSTIIISFFINTTNTEMKRHRDLKKQYDLYYCISCKIEWLIDKLLGIIGYTSSGYIFIDEDNMNYFLKQINRIKVDDCSMDYSTDSKNQIINGIKELIQGIKYEESKLGDTELIRC